MTQTFLTFYFKTGGFGGTGWRSATDAVTDAAGTTLYPDQGVVIVRKVPGDIGLILTGAVKSGPTQRTGRRKYEPGRQSLSGGNPDGRKFRLARR